MTSKPFGTSEKSVTLQQACPISVYIYICVDPKTIVCLYGNLTYARVRGVFVLRWNRLFIVIWERHDCSATVGAMSGRHVYGAELVALLPRNWKLLVEGNCSAVEPVVEVGGL